MSLLRWVAVAVCLLLGAAGAAQTAPVHVVKIVNFSCAACRAADGLDGPIERALLPTGGRFVYATAPDTPDYYWRELAYYAVRDTLPSREAHVRASLYKGAQDMGLRFATPTEVIAWLQQDLALDSAEVDTLRKNLDTDQTRRALARAFRLIQASGATRTPSYVLLRGDTIVMTMDAASAQVAAPADLVRRVVQEIATLTRTQD